MFDTDIAIIGMTPEHHKIIQKWAFDNEWRWRAHNKIVCNQDTECLWLETNQRLSHSNEFWAKRFAMNEDAIIITAQNFINKFIKGEQAMSYSFTAKLSDIDLERIDKECHASGYEAVLVTCPKIDKEHGYLMLHTQFIKKFSFQVSVDRENLHCDWGNQRIADFSDTNDVDFKYYRVKWVKLDEINTIKQQLREAREFLDSKVKVNVHVL